MFFAQSYFYYIPVLLQVICGIHSWRRGTFNRWYFLIIFIPVVGCIIYIYSEILSNRNLRAPKVDIGAIINPGGKIKKLEDNLRFTDTFANKIALADAYLGAGQVDNAIEIYEESLSGAFSDNEHVISQLIVAYSLQQRYADVLTLVPKISRSSKFARSKAHILYAIALEHTGKTEQAEVEFKQMKGRYSNFEHRYEYGLFLKRTGRGQEARQIFTEILDEVPHLSSMEKKQASAWFGKTKDELKRIAV